MFQVKSSFLCKDVTSWNNPLYCLFFRYLTLSKCTGSFSNFLWYSPDGIPKVSVLFWVSRQGKTYFRNWGESPPERGLDGFYKKMLMSHFLHNYIFIDDWVKPLFSIHFLSVKIAHIMPHCPVLLPSVLTWSSPKRKPLTETKWQRPGEKCWVYIKACYEKVRSFLATILGRQVVANIGYNLVTQEQGSWSGSQGAKPRSRVCPKYCCSFLLWGYGRSPLWNNTNQAAKIFAQGIQP